jgi:hypothetical protein
MGGFALLVAVYGISLVFRHFCSNSHDLNDIKYMPCSRGGLIIHSMFQSALLFTTREIHDLKRLCLRLAEIERPVSTIE